MATIPIEVIVQDKASPEPTPTPSDSGETNIVVPDTGAGTVENGSNGGGIGSATNIILPAIILVLAIGAIVALLIRRQQRRKKANDGIKEYDTKESKRTVNRKEKLTTVASGTIAILAATVLVGNLVIPATKAATSVEPGTAELDTVDKITITATREIDSDITVATVKNTSYATANLDFGYKVTASMIEGATTANLYLDGDETSEYYIAPVEDGVLEDNTWGYRLSEEDEDYLTIPLANAPATIIKGNDNTIEDKPVDIYYAIKVDKDMPAGRYIGEVEYTLTDNNFPATLTTMQGMTAEICENTFTPGNQTTDPVPTATLRDTRDNKTYTIAKLADGNCWMTQNLDLDLDSNTTLTPEDTDVSVDWTPLRSTINFTGTSVSGWSNSNTTPYSADPGDVYYYTSNSNADDIRYNSFTECEVAGHTDCSHYHAGNYYNWSAAVASNDTSGTAERFSNVNTSICPASWRLPSNATNSEDLALDNEQDAWISTYEGLVGDLYFGSGSYWRDYRQDGFRKIRIAPLWLVRSGEINNGSLSGFNNGYYQSSTVYDGGYTYMFGINTGGVTPANSVWVSYKTYGFPVRCLAK